MADLTHDEKIAHVGYGAIAALHSVLNVSSKRWVAALRHSFETGAAMDITPYQMAFDGMTLGITIIPANPIWEDARTQFLAMLARYRDVIDQLPTTTMAGFRAAMAEAAETQRISGIATARLAERLGLPANLSTE
jgi:hypothetical protein